MSKKGLMWNLLILLLMPLFVFAEETNEPVIIFIGMWEIIMSIFWSMYVFKPIAQKISPQKEAIPFWIMFIIRAVIIIIFLPTHQYTFVVDFIVFIFANVIASAVKTTNQISLAIKNGTSTVATPSSGGVMICPKCGRQMALGNTRCVECGTNLESTIICTKCKQTNLITSKFCMSCGEALSTGRTDSPIIGPIYCPKCKQEVKEGEKFCRHCGENVEAVINNASQINQNIENIFSGKPIDKNTYNPALFMLNEETALMSLIKNTMESSPESKGKTLPALEKKKLVGTFIYSIISFILISIYVSFHTYLVLGIILWAVATILYVKITKGYSIEKYLLQEVKKRPDEKISYIVSSILSGATSNRAIYLLSKGLIMSLWIISTFVLYNNPHMVYEKTSEGYSLRYYTYGLLKHESVITIPETYKGEKVIGIRGDTFKRVHSLEEITIPNTVKEIRGGTFEECTNLKKVNLPDTIVRIGGSAFKNCKSLETMVLPESITEIGGESFSGCSSLKEINLPENITEIRGETFNECTSLERIVIPDSVTRIGGHAFYDDYSLSEVVISKNSQLQEIGSSAFRLCNKLYSINLPEGVTVNERAFKESPTYITYYSSTDY